MPDWHPLREGSVMGGTVSPKMCTWKPSPPGPPNVPVWRQVSKLKEVLGGEGAPDPI